MFRENNRDIIWKAIWKVINGVITESDKIKSRSDNVERFPIAAILNARRGQVYGAVYDVDGRVLLTPGPYMLTDVLAITDKYPKTVFYGDGVDAYSDILRNGEGNGDERSSVSYNTASGSSLSKSSAYKSSVPGSSASQGSSPESRIFAPENIRYQTADLVVRIAARKYLAGETLSSEELLPDYMRLAEAEQKLNDGTLAKLREAKMKRIRQNG